MSAVSIKEVARRAGVSLGTVSNVLNRPALVSSETRARVEQDDLHPPRNLCVSRRQADREDLMIAIDVDGAVSSVALLPR